MVSTLQELQVEPFDRFLIAANPRVGALSLLEEGELLALASFLLSPERDGLADFFQKMGAASPEQARTKADRFFERLGEDGWLRNSPPSEDGELLNAIYFTITRECNLNCPYCYAGLEEREGKRITVERASRILEMIRQVNPSCLIVITGGEPLTHPQFFQILEETRKKEFAVTLLTNGTLLDGALASRLAGYGNLRHVQVSLDGMTERVHALTRGNSMAAALNAVGHLASHKISFSIAPTLHEQNLHEAPDLAAFAVRSGGYFTPNHLIVLPGKAEHGLTLSNDSLTRALARIGLRLLDECGEKGFGKMTPPFLKPIDDRDGCRSQGVCGIGRNIVDIDWNGDVYPCNILREDKLLLGNLFRDGFGAIFQRSEAMKLRARACQISRCSTCLFVSTCAGGCRAGSYYASGSFDQPDRLCSCRYRLKRHALLLNFYRRRNDLENCKRVLKLQLEASAGDPRRSPALPLASHDDHNDPANRGASPAAAAFTA